jgi:hypothetical protein
MLEYALFEPLQESINERKKIEEIRYEERESKLLEMIKMEFYLNQKKMNMTIYQN